jgi:hypothetical protein
VRRPRGLALSADPWQLRQKALSRWDNEGGGSGLGPQEGPYDAKVDRAAIPQLTNAELVQLRVRVIALENQ